MTVMKLSFKNTRLMFIYANHTLYINIQQHILQFQYVCGMCNHNSRTTISRPFLLSIAVTEYLQNYHHDKNKTKNIIDIMFNRVSFQNFTKPHSKTYIIHCKIFKGIIFAWHFECLKRQIIIIFGNVCEVPHKNTCYAGYS